jgi:3-hydroxyacyl-CoA dehydrogenase
VLPLVEVIRPRAVSDEAMATAFDVAKKLRKSAVQCTDAPAFIVNRLLTRFNGGSIEALRHGNSSRRSTTRSAGSGCRWGRSCCSGWSGLQVALHTAETLEEAFGERFAIDPASGRSRAPDLPGIYDWSAGGEVYPTSPRPSRSRRARRR